MRDFLDLVKRIYIIFVMLTLASVLCFLPVILGCHFQSAWWGLVEIITAPLGVAVGVYISENIDRC